MDVTKQLQLLIESATTGNLQTKINYEYAFLLLKALIASEAKRSTHNSKLWSSFELSLELLEENNIDTGIWMAIRHLLICEFAELNAMYSPGTLPSREIKQKQIGIITLVYQGGFHSEYPPSSFQSIKSLADIFSAWRSQKDRIPYNNNIYDPWMSIKNECNLDDDIVPSKKGYFKSSGKSPGLSHTALPESVDVFLDQLEAKLSLLLTTQGYTWQDIFLGLPEARSSKLENKQIYPNLQNTIREWGGHQIEQTIDFFSEETIRNFSRNYPNKIDFKILENLHALPVDFWCYPHLQEVRFPPDRPAEMEFEAVRLEEIASWSVIFSKPGFGKTSALKKLLWNWMNQSVNHTGFIIDAVAWRASGCNLEEYFVKEIMKLKDFDFEQICEYISSENHYWLIDNFEQIPIDSYCEKILFDLNRQSRVAICLDSRSNEKNTELLNLCASLNGKYWLSPPGQWDWIRFGRTAFSHAGINFTIFGLDEVAWLPGKAIAFMLLSNILYPDGKYPRKIDLSDLSTFKDFQYIEKPQEKRDELKRLVDELFALEMFNRAGFEKPDWFLQHPREWTLDALEFSDWMLSNAIAFESNFASNSDGERYLLSNQYTSQNLDFFTSSYKDDFLEPVLNSVLNWLVSVVNARQIFYKDLETKRIQSIFKTERLKRKYPVIHYVSRYTGHYVVYYRNLS